MNQKLFLAVSVAVIALVAAGFWLYFAFGNASSVGNNAGTVNPLAGLEQSCKNSGGNVIAALCCGSASDFPNLCVIGACGCSPENSHQVEICDCPPGECFNGTACVAN